MAIVGAGIHGCALARELTLRGVSCAVVDKGAVGGGTSQWSSQLLHGGIRYLQTGDIRQMREGLAERAAWAEIAPWRVRWESFWMPHRGFFEGLSHRLGIGLYDAWGSERPGWPSTLRLGAVPAEAFKADPRAAHTPFRGAVAYADLMTWDRDLVRDLAASSDAIWLDFHELEGFDDEPGLLKAAHLRDLRDGSPRTVHAKNWVFALGPWNDRCMLRWFGESWKRLRLSSGIHIWFDAPELLARGCEHPWAMMRGKGRILFVIPRDGLLQVGTTERAVEDGCVPIVDGEREELFTALEANIPAIPWRKLPVRMEESGVRPLARPSKDQAGTAGMSREAVLETHAKFSNLRLVLGGKLTTARALMDRLATDITGRICPESRTRTLNKWDGQSAGLQ
ncbi:MAG: FAD-dependent oxidoreductase [Acidobacteriota bacterium]|nr:FAD-dependent oxidoreductase [Acidobacteriota bacterium]